jgi:integrase
MANSKPAPLPSKPRPDFPLFPHATRRWAKKVRGKLVYFGSTNDDPKGKAALERWLDQKDDLLAGRVPRARQATTEGPVLADLVNSFLTAKESLRDNGELAPRTYKRYYDTCEMLVKYFGRDRRLDDLRTSDFTELRANMAKRWGAVALANEIQNVRTLFKFGDDAEILSKPMKFGPMFKKPRPEVFEKEKAKRESLHGKRMFTPDQIQALVKVASPNMKAMILLGLNGGLSNTDIGLLTIVPFDLENGWLDYARTKTGISRRIPLWPETVDAVKEVQKTRRQPVDPSDEHLLFIGPRGESFVGNHKGYRVTAAFEHVAKDAGVTGRVFYDLRRTLETIGEDKADLVAVQKIMGHTPRANDMSARYRQHVSDERLRAVVDHVRAWAFKKTA